MKQITQNYKTGELKIEDVPVPVVGDGQLLVRNHFSAISSGTEGMKIEQAGMSMLGKAKARPDHVKKVMSNIKKEGVINTYKKVIRKLDSATPLGYSCAGEVIDIGKGVHGFECGDRVACGGQGASHAQVIAVYPNLCAKIPNQVTYRDASYSTLGAIAMQGVRQAEVSIGENVAVIGLGLIGLITVQILKAAGCTVIGADIDNQKLARAKENGCDEAVENGMLKNAVDNITGGKGADSVIITASTDSLEPVELAGDVLRKKGRVVIVGAVPTGFSRENYYRKELELKMSSSYGPGRYDRDYEEKGVDYPYGYVRWTEKRNMEAFLKLVQERKLDIDKINTDQFDFNNAQKAYSLIKNQNEDYAGITLEYDVDSEVSTSVKIKEPEIDKSSKAVIGMAGAGNFGQNYLIPYLAKNSNVRLKSILSGTGLGAVNAARRFGFENAVSKFENMLQDKEINSIVIATRHDMHAEYVIKSLKAGKHVFVEKPLALTETELEDIMKAYDESSGKLLMVGFNRRYCDFAVKVKEYFPFQLGPVSIMARINAGRLPDDSWIKDPDIGGGRIIGEVCHFIDLCRYWAGSPLINIYAQALPGSSHEDVQIMLKYGNGAIGMIQYITGGSQYIPKEYYEVSAGGKTAVIDDFKKLYLSEKNVKRFRKSQDKGHRAEMNIFADIVAQGGDPAKVSIGEILETSKAVFLVEQSLKTGGPVSLK